MSDCELERFSSVKSVQDTFDTVPDDKRFKFKLLSKGVEVDRFCYTLRKGKELPVTKKLENKFKYCKSIKKESLNSNFMSFVGYSVLFSSQLLPSFEGFIEGVEREGYWANRAYIVMRAGRGIFRWAPPLYELLCVRLSVRLSQS